MPNNAKRIGVKLMLTVLRNDEIYVDCGSESCH